MASRCQRQEMARRLRLEYRGAQRIDVREARMRSTRSRVV